LSGRKVKLAHEKRNPEKGVKNIIKKRNPEIQGLAVTPSVKGRGNGKKTYMGVGGAAREKGRRDEGWNEISA
jgi:hypothetical protein